MEEGSARARARPDITGCGAWQRPSRPRARPFNLLLGRRQTDTSVVGLVSNTIAIHVEVGVSGAVSVHVDSRWMEERFANSPSAISAAASGEMCVCCRYVRAKNDLLLPGWPQGFPMPIRICSFAFIINGNCSVGYYTRGEAPSFWPLFTFRRRGCLRKVYCSSMCLRINPSRLVPVNALSLMKETCKKFKI